MNKILLLTTPRGPYSDYLNNQISSNDYGIDVCYSLIGKNKNRLVRALRKFWLKYLPFKSIFFDRWKRNLKYYELIVIIRDQYGEIIAEYITKKSNCKTVLFFMDPMKKSSFLRPLPNNPRYLVSSFEKSVCEQNGYLYSPLFFFKENKKLNVVRDVFFVGTDKGRLPYLLNIQALLSNKGLKTEFHICKSPNRSYKDDKEYAYKSPIPYRTVLEKERESRAILDILPDGQEDLTLRCYESYFLSKKLITNNRMVVKYKFYNKNNVFILGLDDLEEISLFLNTPYLDVFDEELEKANFEKWIKRF